MCAENYVCRATNNLAHAILQIHTHRNYLQICVEQICGTLHELRFCRLVQNSVNWFLLRNNQLLFAYQSLWWQTERSSTVRKTNFPQVLVVSLTNCSPHLRSPCPPKMARMTPPAERNTWSVEREGLPISWANSPLAHLRQNRAGHPNRSRDTPWCPGSWVDRPLPVGGAVWQTFFQ